jgi:hypothetical protein
MTLRSGFSFMDPKAAKLINPEKSSVRDPNGYILVFSEPIE